MRICIGSSSGHWFTFFNLGGHILSSRIIFRVLPTSMLWPLQVIVLTLFIRFSTCPYMNFQTHCAFTSQNMPTLSPARLLARRSLISFLKFRSHSLVNLNGKCSSSSKVLTGETMNPYVKQIQYAVRGAIVQRAGILEKELAKVRLSFFLTVYSLLTQLKNSLAQSE